MKNICYSFAAAFALCFAGGCINGTLDKIKPDRHINSAYEPVGQLHANASPALTIVTFETKADGDPKLIGRLENLDGVRVADIIQDDGTPGSWLADALAQELTRAGCQVTRAAATPASGTSILINGSVEKFFVQVGVAYQCDVAATFLVKKNGQSCLNRQFATNYAEFSLTGSGSGCQKALKSSVQAIMKQALPEILKSLE